VDRRVILLALLVVAIVVGAYLVMGDDDPAPEEGSEEGAIVAAPEVVEPPPDPGPRPEVPEPKPLPEPGTVDEPRPADDPPEKTTPESLVAENTAKLDVTRITLKLEDAPVLDVFERVGEILGMRVYAHPNLDAKLLDSTVSFDFREVPGRTMLDFIRAVKFRNAEWVVTAEGAELRPK